MKKQFKRAFSLLLAIALITSLGTLQSVTPAAATNRINRIVPGQVVMIRNVGSGLFMTALNNGNVEQRAFNGNNNQQWRVFNDLSSIWAFLGYDGLIFVLCPIKICF